MKQAGIDSLWAAVIPVWGISSPFSGSPAATAPWKFPLMIGVWKIAPALAACNGVVVKPSQIASLMLLRLAQLGAEAGCFEGRAVYER